MNRELSGTEFVAESGPGPGPGDCRERLLLGMEGRVAWEIMEDSYCHAAIHLMGML